MKKAVLALAVLMLLPLLGQAQSITGYVDPAFQRTMQEAGVTIRVNSEVEDAIVYAGGGGASGTGGGGWHTSAHHWDINILKKVAKNFSYRHGQILNIVRDEKLDNTYEALVALGEDPLLTAIELGDKERKEAILRSLSSSNSKFFGKVYSAVIPWKVYSPVSSSSYGYSSYSFSAEYKYEKVILSDEGAKKAQQILTQRQVWKDLQKKNGESLQIKR